VGGKRTLTILKSRGGGRIVVDGRRCKCLGKGGRVMMGQGAGEGNGYR